MIIDQFPVSFMARLYISIKSSLLYLRIPIFGRKGIWIFCVFYFIQEALSQN